MSNQSPKENKSNLKQVLKSKDKIIKSNSNLYQPNTTKTSKTQD